MIKAVQYIVNNMINSHTKVAVYYNEQDIITIVRKLMA